MTEAQSASAADTLTAPRRRDAGASRDKLLQAASELFAERGYEGTTIRELGLRAGVDSALIARYFGGKAQLYLAALRHGAQPYGDFPIDLRSSVALRGLMDRVSPKGPSPTLRAAIKPHEPAELQQAALEILQRRLMAPAVEAAETAGLENSQLRAEIAVATLAGVMLSRTSAALSTLSGAQASEVAELLAQMFGVLLRADDGA